MYRDRVKIADVLSNQYPDFLEYCVHMGKVYTYELSDNFYKSFAQLYSKPLPYVDAIKRKIYEGSLLLQYLDQYFETIFQDNAIDDTKEVSSLRIRDSIKTKIIKKARRLREMANWTPRYAMYICGLNAAEMTHILNCFVRFPKENDGVVPSHHSQRAKNSSKINRNRSYENITADSRKAVNNRNQNNNNAIQQSENQKWITAAHEQPEKKLYELLEIDPEAYSNFDEDVSDLELSVRAINCLHRVNCRRLVDLVRMPIGSLLGIKNMGIKTYCEICSVVLRRANKPHMKTNSNTKKVQFDGEKWKRVEDYLSHSTRELSLEDLTQDQIAVFNAIKESSDIVGKEILFETLSHPSSIKLVCDALSDYSTQLLLRDKANEYLLGIPAERRNMNVRWLASCYTDKESFISEVMEMSDDDDSLAAFIVKNTERIDAVIRLRIFLQWCSFDIRKEADTFFASLSPREQMIIEGRSKKLTLNDLGVQLGVSRERIRQIEAKVIRKFKRFQGRSRIRYKLLIDLQETKAISLLDVTQCLGQCGSSVAYMLANCPSGEFTYDSQLDALIYADSSMPDRIQTYIDTLPDVFFEDKLDELLQAGEEEFSCSKTVLHKAIIESYKKTGDKYHRTKLTLAAMYSTVFKQYYPNGIKIYDETQIESFRKHIWDDYHLDLRDKNSHAIGTVLARVGILRGRGLYVYRGKEPLISAELASRIHEYINSSPQPIFMTNTIFSVFEEELLAENIDNKYYLQAILRELFENEWYFRRDYITKDRTLTTIYSSITGYIRKAHRPVSKQEIYDSFPGITEIVINMSTDDANIINLFGEYLHVSCLVISHAERVYLQTIIEKALRVKGVCSCHYLYNEIMREKPEILKRNYIYYAFGCYSLLYYLFGEDYVFSRPFIAKNNFSIDRPIELIREMVCEAEVLAIADLQEFAREQHYAIYSMIDFINSFNDTHLLISKTEIATFGYIGIDENIAKEIETLILTELSETVSISQLHCISKLPRINVPWNSWLIYSILKKWSEKIEVSLSYPQFRSASPLVSLRGKVDASISFIDNDPNNGMLMEADDLDKLDELIANYIVDEMGDL